MTILLQNLFIAIGLVVLYSLFRPRQVSAQNNTVCIDQYFILRKKILSAETDKDLNMIEDYVHEFFADNICHANNDLVRRLSGQLHAALNNQGYKLHGGIRSFSV